LRTDTGGIFVQVLSVMDKAESTAFNKIIEYMSALTYDSALVDQVVDSLYSILQHEYTLDMTSSQFKEMVHKQVDSTYRGFVTDDPLRNSPNLTLADRRAAQYLENADKLYLGQFIQDPGVKQAVVDYIRKAYIENGAAIGNSPRELQAFVNALGEQLDLEKWRIRMIIDTTVSKARTYSQLQGMRQAGARSFEVVGPDDNLTCVYCQDMLGRTFELAPELTRLDQVINAGPEGMAIVKPFLKGGLGLKELEKTSDADVQSMGFACPPFHPSCRHSLAVVDFYENASEIPYSMEAV